MGRMIYEEGRLPSGAPLVGQRQGEIKISGKPAACVQCHRPSGMGSVEGDFLVPPITGKALYSSSDKVIASMDPRRGRSFNQSHEPYTDATLALAIRLGKHVSGRDMNVIMPRYNLSDAELHSVVAYLKQLSPDWSVGVEHNAIHFATIITPEVSAERKQAFISTLRATFNQKNANTMPGRRHMVSGAEMVLRTERPWNLHIWELQGSPDSWAQQIEAFYQKQPVFALVSGLSDSTWEPVHNFCESKHVPCWFPSAPLTSRSADSGRYSLYFSRGASLEADVLAQHLSQQKDVKRVVQVMSKRADVIQATESFEQALLLRSKETQHSQAVERWSLDQWHSKAQNLSSTDALLLWLDAKEFAALTASNSTGFSKLTKIFLPASLRAMSSNSLPDAWRDRVHLIYPYELPSKRGANLSYFHYWLNVRKLPIVDEAMQSEVYFAVNYLSDTLAEMLDNLYRDYLIERAESMLSRWEARKAEDESRERGSLRRVARAAMPQQSEAMLGKREAVSVYPRLSLGPGQRFASKGAYIVRLPADTKAPLIAETDWIIPQ